MHVHVKPLRYVSLILLLLTMSAGLAQQAVKGCVYDNDTKKPLADVIIVYNFGNQQLQSDSSGHFRISNIHPRSSLLFKKLGYANALLSVESDSAGTRPLVMYMSKKQVELSEVNVLAEKLSPVVKNKSFYIDDYFILPDNKFLLITDYPGESGFNLMLADIHNKVVCMQKFDHEAPEGIFLDCVGNLHLLTDQYARQVVNTSDTSFYLMEALPRADFDKIVMPCVAKVDKSFFFARYNKPRSFVREGVKINVNSNTVLVYKVENHQADPVKYIAYDKNIMRMYKDEIKFQDMRRELSKQKGVVGGINYSPEDILVAYQFIFRKIYAPLYIKNDTVVLFDFSDREIDLYNAEGKCVKKAGINVDDFPQYHEFQILSDRVTGKMYLLNKQLDGEYLQEINIYTGAITRKTRISRPLGKKVQVYDDEIYYIVKEHDWDDTSYLYRQRM